jgi:hypothetical protein
LPFAALKNIERVSYGRIIRDKRVLHFAPEEFLMPLVLEWATTYVTADFLRTTTMAGIEK